MPFPLLIIPIAMGVAGAGLSAKGTTDVVKSRRKIAKSRDRLECALADYEDRLAETAALVVEYSCLVAKAHAQHVVPMAEWITRHHMKAQISDRAQVGWVDYVVPDAPRADGLGQLGVDVAGTAIAATLIGTAAPATAVGLTAMFGTASTGTAIGSLSGVAASNASLALLGGGPLAAGGGGVAAGSALLSALAPGVGLAVGGMSLLMVGESQKTSAKSYQADVDAAIAQIVEAGRLLDQVDQAVREAMEVLGRLMDRVRVAQSTLFTIRGFDPGRDAEVFAIAVALTRAISLILRTPVLDPATGLVNGGFLTVLDDVRHSTTDEGQS